MTQQQNKKLISILKNGGIAVMPTDTMYGLVGSALNPETVERIYTVRGRDRNKPLIVLIDTVSRLNVFGVVLRLQDKKILEQVWPGKVTVVLPVLSKKFLYLHRGTQTIAFRLPKNIWLRQLLKKTGPLVAPSANPQDLPVATSVRMAKKYFGNRVDFYCAGPHAALPSTLLSLVGNKPHILRAGAGSVPKTVSSV